jgi:fatty-acyl-CoA synthase
MGDVLRLGGFLVSPAEIESHLLDHASVADVQVVGASTPNGIRPVGFVTLRPGQPFDEAALIQHCVSGLAKFKAPLRIIPVEAFPTTQSANGTKIQRGKLREMAEQGLAEAAPRLAGD